MKINLKNKVVLIYGMPATGKYSVAKELAKKTGAALLDNHYFNNVIMPFTDVNSNSLPAINKEIYKIRSSFLSMVSKYKKEEIKGFIFTNVLLDSRADKKALKELQKFAKDLKFDFIPVELTCNIDELAKRVDTIDRKERHKLTDKDILKSFVANTKFLNIKHKNKITIDVNSLSLEQAIKEVCDKLSFF